MATWMDKLMIQEDQDKWTSAYWEICISLPMITAIFQDYSLLDKL